MGSQAAIRRSAPQVPRHGLAWASCDRAPAAADGSILSSLWIRAPDSCCLAICGMAAKAVSTTARDQAAALEAADRQRALYEAQWQALSPHSRLRTLGAAPGGCKQQRAALHVSQPGAAAAARYTLPAAADSGWAAGCTLAAGAAQAAVLQLAALSAGGSLAALLQTHGGQPACTAAGWPSSLPASAAALGLQSMLRVAAAEMGGMQFASVDVAAPEHQPRVASSRCDLVAAAASSCTCHAACVFAGGRPTAHILAPQPCCRDSAELAGLDAFGRSMQASAWLAPRLLPREVPALSAPRLSSQLSGSVLITGGLGALGSLAAHWLSGLGSCDAWLLGRSGRTGAALHA